MAARRSALDPDPAELARRRLSLLGAELAPVARAGSETHRPETHRPETHRPETRPPQVRGSAAAPGESTGTDEGPPGPTGSRRHAGARVSWFSRLTGRALDALPPTMHGRVGISAHHVTVIALLLAAAMAAATWMLARAEPRALPQHASLRLPASAPSAPAPVGPAGPAGSAAPVSVTAPPPVGSATAPAAVVPSVAPTGEVVVHVAGRVRHPGVVELPAGSRVVDAIEAAGGARPGAHLGRLNLARPLVDGEQIAVGIPGAAAPPALGSTTGSTGGTGSTGSTGSTGVAVVPGATGAATGLVNINTASQAELEELPGVGPVTATSIIEWRTENGGFSTVDELIDVSGIGEVTLGELRPLVTV